MLLSIEPPDVPASQRARGHVGMRYEDIAQDGSLKIGGMPHAIGMVCFRDLWLPTQLHRELRPQGIVPILSRMVMQSTGRPIAVRNHVEAEGSCRVGHARDAAGAVSRLVVEMHAELFAPAGRTYDPQPPNAGERLHVGRVYAEHVITRPFGPPAQRKVLSLPLSTGEYVPETQLPAHDAQSTLALPAEGEWLDPALALDAAPLAFGVTHTDSNQHVNSLVYPQLFEDAALRRLIDLGEDIKPLLVDHIDISFRKPCFAGERMYLWLRAFRWQGKLGTVGYLGPRDCPPERAHCLCALTFAERL
jgi:hypothetical protein